MTPSHAYKKEPAVVVEGGAGKALQGWSAVAARLAASGRVLVVECYPGVHVEEIVEHVAPALGEALVVDTREVLMDEAAIDALVARDVTDDPVFGHLSLLRLEDFLDAGKLERARGQVAAARGPVLVVGPGASLVTGGDCLVVADLARWEAQLRFRRGESTNLGARNAGSSASLQYKRAFFVDWRVADRVKKDVLPRAGFLLDTNVADDPRLVEGPALRAALAQAARQPFRVVPFFDPAPWGGQWMRERFALPDGPPNYGWCFDCVPEENSLYLLFGDTRVEVPSINVVFFEPRALLGDGVHARFGTEFPIRTDFLDTMGGGNLSFQVHPTTEYIHDRFGMHYTQDESYYMLDAGPGASVYLGVKPQCDLDAMVADLREAASGGEPFDAAKHANQFPARRHDHFLIPAGTVHCSGANSMVLEISATPYIFTFKLWDWGRLGLDGKPRPTHIDHGARVIDTTRDTRWVEQNLINAVAPVASGPGWREERTGLHEREFIETRRFWFTAPTSHDTRGNLNVLNLVQGGPAIIESPDGRFAPTRLDFAETIIIPAAVGPYVVRPEDSSPGDELALLKIFVRTGLPGGECAPFPTPILDGCPS